MLSKKYFSRNASILPKLRAARHFSKCHYHARHSLKQSIGHESKIFLLISEYFYAAAAKAASHATMRSSRPSRIHFHARSCYFTLLLFYYYSLWDITATVLLFRRLSLLTHIRAAALDVFSDDAARPHEALVLRQPLPHACMMLSHARRHMPHHCSCKA